MSFIEIDPSTGEEVVIEEVTVACATEGCENFGIDFLVRKGLVQCGACGAWIVGPDEIVEG